MGEGVYLEEDLIVVVLMLASNFLFVLARWYGIIQNIRGGGGTRMSRGYQARPKIHIKRVFFHSWALYVCNMNRVSNSCEIGLKGFDF